MTFDPEHLASRLTPILRSVTGDGTRDTLAILGEHVPIEVTELPTGTPVLDWVVPDEWNVTEAWIKGPAGNTIVDLADGPLHLMGYSPPLHRTMSLEELRPHLHSIPELPDTVPFRTSIWDDRWGFCVPDRVLSSLPDGEYEVYIGGSLEPGSLTYGESVVPGTGDHEILLTTITCHPAMANEGTSGMVVLTDVLHRLADRRPGPHAVRALFVPGTIGSISWLSQNRERVGHIVGGITVVAVGDERPLTYKRTVGGSATVDRAAALVLGEQDSIVDYVPYGYDERQFNSVGFRAPVGALMRARHGEYPEYHSSADSLEFISGAQMTATADTLVRVIDILQHNRTVLNLAPDGEPRLGPRGLYTPGDRAPRPELATSAILWVLSLADGDHDLIDIATRSGMDFEVINHAAKRLEEAGLVRRVDG